MDMRSKFNETCEVYDVVRLFQNGLAKKARAFYVELADFEREINGSAMRHGLSRIPEEVLSEILLYITRDLRSTVRLSHVCRKFRSTIVSCRAFWKNFELSSAWTPNQVRCIAERSKFMGLRAVIRGYDPNGPILTDTVKAILGLRDHLEILRVENVGMVNVGKIERYLRRRGMPKLWKLEMTNTRDADANFKGFCEMPSLRALHIDFIPNDSLGPSLTRCNLTLQRLRLSDLFRFLSSSPQLRDLSIDIRHCHSGGQEAEKCDPIALRNLRSLTVWANFPHRLIRKVIQKIRSPVIRTLAFTGGSATTDKEIFDTARLKPSVRHLHISWLRHQIDFAMMPPYIEVLTLSGIWTGRAVVGNPESLRALRLRILQFRGSSRRDVRESVKSCRDTFLKYGHDGIRFAFLGCEDINDGIYELDKLDFILRNESQ